MTIVGRAESDSETLVPPIAAMAYVRGTVEGLLPAVPSKEAEVRHYVFIVGEHFSPRGRAIGTGHRGMVAARSRC